MQTDIERQKQAVERLVVKTLEETKELQSWGEMLSLDVYPLNHSFGFTTDSRVTDKQLLAIRDAFGASMSSITPMTTFTASGGSSARIMAVLSVAFFECTWPWER